MRVDGMERDVDRRKPRPTALCLDWPKDIYCTHPKKDTAELSRYQTYSEASSPYPADLRFTAAVTS